MKKLWYIFVVSIVFLCQACRQNTADVEQCLDAAEDLMIERPDSALSILENISIEQVSSRKDRARYALLYTQAKDKNFIDETDIKLISEAKEYYEDSDNVKSKYLSLYYYGRILCNNKEYPSAIIAYTKAETLLDKLNDDYLAGLLYVQIGNIYRTYHDWNKSLEAYKSAYSHYSKANIESHMSYALLDIGLAYWNVTNTVLAEEYIIKSLQLAESRDDKYLERICYENLVILYDEIDEIEKCETAVAMLNDKFDQSLFSSVCLASIASHNAKTKKIEFVESFLVESWEKAQNKSDSIALYFQSANIMKTVGNADKALAYFEKGIILQNDKLHLAMQQPILSIQKDYFENQARYNSYRLKKNTEIYITLSIIVLLMVIVIVMYMRHRILAKDIEICKYMDLAKELQASIHDKDIQLSEISIQAEADNSRLKEMSNHIAELFHKQYELLDKLSNTYYETHGYSREKESIYEQVKSEINKFANDKKSIAQLEAIVNTYKRNVLNLIRSEIPGMSERDIKLLCYIYAGFSAKTISIFIGETTGNIITRKSRLRSKITKLDTANKSIMLQEMP